MPAPKDGHGVIWPIRKSRFGPLIALLSIATFSLACGSQSRGDSEGATPIASFSTTQTGGPPGTTIQFTDTSTGEITGRAWDFGTLGTSTEVSPVITYPSTGSYSVGLTVTGPRGMSRVLEPGLIEIGDSPTAGSSCLPLIGFAPLTINCTDSSTGADDVLWDFGDGSTSNQRNVQHVYTSVGSYTVELLASSAGGTDTASEVVEALPLALTATPSTAPAPVNVLFTAETGGLTGFIIWTVDGELVGTSLTIPHRFRAPGTYAVEFIFFNEANRITGQQSIEYVVGYGPASAAFVPSVSGGSGPLDIVFADDSTGAIDSWEWDFGDGNQCVLPADVNGLIPTCDSSSPTHTYLSVGQYDVSLRVTGPAENISDPPITSSTLMSNAVRVHIVDPSFELQTENEAIGGDWIHLRPTDALEVAEHIALSVSSDPTQADGGMPTEGSNWAVLDGLGTDGTTAVDILENGIRQDFLKPLDQTVLEFDYALLYSEPPASLVLDAITATVTDGVTTVEIPSARANVSSPFAGPSALFPTRDGSAVRMTPVFTASIDLANAFPTAADETLFTLTVRTGNQVNEFRSPRAYVDNIRFVAPGDAVTAQFVLDTDPVVVGQEAQFTDESCPDPIVSGCTAPTSWRWDFDTQLLANPPVASGSGEQSPRYVFPETGVYDVRLVTRLAELESETNLLVTVIDGPMASFSLTPDAPYSAPATLTFSDESTSDPSDPIIGWSWDFGGWGTSLLEAPAPVTIGQTGDWLMRLTVTTASGETNTFQFTIQVD